MKKHIKFTISNEALGYLAIVQPNEKSAPKKLKRLIRIRRNFFRELDALNRELNRQDLSTGLKVKQDRFQEIEV